MPPKTHRTAVAALPPEEIWEPIQAIRRRYDRQIHRWMPHINLLYPFVPFEHFAAAVPRLTTACQQVPAFQVTLAVLRSFTHASQRSTIWLEPQPRHAWVRLQTTLQAAFPSYDEQSRFAAGFTPHLSVGQVASPPDLQRILAELQAEWQPLQFSLTSIALIWRHPDGPFQVDRRVPLAS